jgi:hypothetical protein
MSGSLRGEKFSGNRLFNVNTQLGGRKLGSPRADTHLGWALDCNENKVSEKMS